MAENHVFRMQGSYQVRFLRPTMMIRTSGEFALLCQSRLQDSSMFQSKVSATDIANVRVVMYKEIAVFAYLF